MYYYLEICFDQLQNIQSMVQLLPTSDFNNPPHIFYFKNSKTLQDCENSCLLQNSCFVYTFYPQNYFDQNFRFKCFGRSLKYQRFMTEIGKHNFFIIFDHFVRKKL